MTSSLSIKQSNAQFASQQHAGYVCVFEGATSGIGAATLERVVQMLDAPTLYILGRSEASFETQRAKLQNLNPGCKIIFLETEISLLSGIDAACKEIVAAEKKVDYLYMSAGMLPYAGAQYTKEGLETTLAISYYSRMRLLTNLLPLLYQSPHPRVLSVLNGGREQPMLETDLGLETHWASRLVMNHITTMTSLAHQHLAKESPQLTILHAFPGLVRTDIFVRLQALEGARWWKRLGLVLFRGVVAILMRVIGQSTEVSGERQAFHLTSERYVPGAWRVDQYSEVVTKSGVFEDYVERGWGEKVWEHTVGVFERVLSL